MEDILLENIVAILSECFEKAEIVAKICDLNESLAAKVKDIKAGEPMQDSLSMMLVTAHQEFKKLEELLQMEKCHSTKLDRWLTTCKLKLEATEQTDNPHLWLEQDLVLQLVQNLYSKKSSLESQLGAFEASFNNLQLSKYMQLCHPIRSNHLLPPSGSSGFPVISSNFPMYEGRKTLGDVTAIHFAGE